MAEKKCAIDLALASIGGKWKLLVLCKLRIEPVIRFRELRRRIGDISEKVLITQLKELEKDGYINRQVYAEVPPRVEYSLTDKGKSLFPVLDSLALWAEDNF